MEHWWIPTFFNFLQSLGASCSLFFFFFFLLLCSVALFLRSLFSFIPWFTTYLGRGEISWAEFSGKRISTPFCFKFIFIPSCLNKNYGINTTMLCGKKRKTFCSLSSAGSWRVLGPCVVVHRILAFFLHSLYIGLRDYTVSMWIWTVSIYQHVSVYFLLFKKRKKNLKNGIIEGQQRVGLRCWVGLSGHFDNMASPLACLIVMFNRHPCSLRWHF